MKLQFLGATGTVTGSKYLLSTAKQKILIDCGMFQGLKQLRLRNWNPFPTDISKIDAVLLTHAHMDHTGALPLIVKKGYSNPVYTTMGTNSLSSILLPDAAYLQQEEAKYLNKHNLSKHKPALPLYDLEEAQKALALMKPIEWGKNHDLGDIKFKFHPVGHLLGASFLEIHAEGKTIIFSGDVGRDESPLHQNKPALTETDYLVLESTYGDRLHSKENVEDKLAKIITDTTNRGGVTLIPSFAVGRAQVILYYIHKLKKSKRIPDIPVFLNSPMAIKATEIYKQYADDLKLSRDEMTNIFKGVQYVRDPAQSQQLNETKKPAIILSASGMMSGGRILHHVKSMGPNPRNSIVIAGFQAAGTRGEALVRGKRRLKIHGQYVPILAQVHNLEGLSAHADYQEIISWIRTIKKKPKRTFIVHGEPIAAEEMRKQIEEQLNWDCCLPDYKEEIEL